MSEPLLNQRNSYDDDGEEISLESNDWIPNEKKPSFFHTYRKVIYGGCAVGLISVIGIAIALTTSSSLASFKPESYNEKQDNHQPIRNVIMMISDGLGPASVSFARTYYQYKNDHPYDFQMPLDTIHVGQSRTRSSSSLVTDSAAGATAFSCGLKTFNGAVGVDPENNPCGTVLESAKHKHGMLTGLVATSRITHATPASFSAHVIDRNNENAIALQQIGQNPLGRSVDLMFGGGYCHFIPKSEKGGCRLDSRNLLEEATEKYNWSTVIHNNREGFDDLSSKSNILPVMSLFSSDHMSYEIDRDPKNEPSLSEMSKKALDILYESSKNKEKGFFLMIEGSRIDMAAHSNDAPAHVHDILEYQNTVDLVKKYVDEHPDTIMISTSDHETGGLSLARQISSKYPDYLWYPDVITKTKSSSGFLSNKIKQQKGKVTRKYIIENILRDGLGITDASNREINKLMDKKGVDKYLADMVSVRAQLGWATHGHSGVDVNLYAYGKGTEELRGSHENIEIGHFISRTLGLSLGDITKKLNLNNDSFHLGNLTASEKLEYNEDLEHYHQLPPNVK
ncbi:alkaline phosphatase-like protein, partial [Backusella circina FSU 941]